jgi:hypothetical protein
MSFLLILILMLSRADVATRIQQLPEHQQAEALAFALKVYGPARNKAANKYEVYQSDPVGYAKRELGVRWWHKQQEVARALVEHQKVFVKASHDVGKTFLAGGLVSWHYDCFDPGLTLTTAPTKKQVVDLTWKEVRLQRGGRGMMPKAPRIESYFADGSLDAGHLAAGFTARDANAFQGSHEEDMLIIFEEAVGISEEFWTGAEGMLSSGEGNRWLAIMNPTDTGSMAYQEELSGDWHIITISAMDHPNLMAELCGEPKPFPKAISLAWFEGKLKKWCTPISARDAKATDVCWPPLDYCKKKGVEPQWYRPGPLFEGKVLGRWPSQGTDTVWSEAQWLAAIEAKPDLQAEAENHPVEIGCDVARFGDDDTTMHVRRGPVSLHHEAHNGWPTDRTTGRLKELAAEYGQQAGQEAAAVLVKVDDDGVGGAVYDQRGEYNFVGLSAASVAMEPEKYPNRRSEFWFAVAERANEGRLDLSRLSADSLNDLRSQLMAPRWKQDGQGRRVVEPKSETKKRIKRSPDDADGLNLCYAPAASSPNVW